MMQRFPWAHRAGMSFIGRFVDDLERRYPSRSPARETPRRLTDQERRALNDLRNALMAFPWGSTGSMLEVHDEAAHPL